MENTEYQLFSHLQNYGLICPPHISTINVNRVWCMCVLIKVCVKPPWALRMHQSKTLIDQDFKVGLFIITCRTLGITYLKMHTVELRVCALFYSRQYQLSYRFAASCAFFMQMWNSLHALLSS